MTETLTLFTFDVENVLNEDILHEQLLRLIELCDGAGIDIDRIFNEAMFAYSGEPDVEESG
ncbi:MAG: hypothetical protein J0H19_08655 [Rhodospirillales bacterium]|nr:hypothetical protein [Rhodospirillales bacterium]